MPQTIKDEDMNIIKLRLKNEKRTCPHHRDCLTYCAVRSIDMLPCATNQCDGEPHNLKEIKRVSEKFNCRDPNFGKKEKNESGYYSKAHIIPHNIYRYDDIELATEYLKYKDPDKIFVHVHFREIYIYEELFNEANYEIFRRR